MSNAHFLINVLWFAGVQHYNEIKDISICEFLPPHLVVYVDQPAQEVQKKLKQSGKVVRNSLKPHDTVISVSYWDYSISVLYATFN